jgi:hypothetical protein
MPRTPSAKISRHPRADIADAIEPIERAEAKKRQGARTDLTGNSRKVRGPTALDKVGKVIGKDRKTIVKARAIRDAAEQNPKKFGKLKDDMDRNGRVDGGPESGINKNLADRACKATEVDPSSACGGAFG